MQLTPQTYILTFHIVVGYEHNAGQQCDPDGVPI